MFCSQCGEEINEDSRFCRHCGAPQTGTTSSAPLVAAKGADVSGSSHVSSNMTVEAADDSTRSSTLHARSSGQTNPARFIIPAAILLLIVFAAIETKPGASTESPTNLTELDPAGADNYALAKVDSTTKADAAPPQPASKWAYHTSEDAVRGKTTYFADVSSSNEIQQGPPYGSSGMKLQLRNSPAYGIDAILILDSGQIVCRPYDGCSATYSIDGGKPQRIGLNTPADYSSDAVFIQGSRGFISKLKKAKRLVIELDIYEAGRPQFEFPIEGLEWKHS